MAAQKEKLNDKWFRLIGVPFIAFMSHIIFFNEAHGHDERFSFWEIYLISVGETLVLWESIRLVLRHFRNRYPELHQSRKRILAQFVVAMLVTVAIRYLTIWIYDQTLFWGYVFPPEGYLYNIFIGMLYVLIVGGIYEGLYFFRKWKQYLSESEALKRENLQTQLESLKTQINPHFLFNNLSSLASLIMEDQEKAVTFIKELSAVYRYLLQANDKTLNTLKAELNFIDNYFHLLKTRFGEGVELIYEIDEDYLEWLLPPLTLQILIENAVKHNATLPERPLQIHLYTDKAGNLVVHNNLQKKSSLIISNQLGLRNIQEKYRLLHQQAVTINQNEKVFQVTIPLIKNEVYEPIDRGR